MLPFLFSFEKSALDFPFYHVSTETVPQRNQGKVSVSSPTPIETEAHY